VHCIREILITTYALPTSTAYHEDDVRIHDATSPQDRLCRASPRPASRRWLVHGV